MGKIIDYDIEYDPDYGYYRNYSKSLKVSGNGNDSFKVRNLQDFKEKSSIDNNNNGNGNSRHAQLDYNCGRIYTSNENVLKTKYIKYNHFYKLYNMEIIYCKIKYNFIDLEECAYGNSL